MLGPNSKQYYFLLFVFSAGGSFHSASPAHHGETIGSDPSGGWTVCGSSPGNRTNPAFGDENAFLADKEQKPENAMRMKELTAPTGVSKGAIQLYINEGLIRKRLIVETTRKFAQKSIWKESSREDTGPNENAKGEE